jgi:hypothetical protein
MEACESGVTCSTHDAMANSYNVSVSVFAATD